MSSLTVLEDVGSGVGLTTDGNFTAVVSIEAIVCVSVSREMINVQEEVSGNGTAEEDNPEVRLSGPAKRPAGFGSRWSPTAVVLPG